MFSQTKNHIQSAQRQSVPPTSLVVSFRWLHTLSRPASSIPGFCRPNRHGIVVFGVVKGQLTGMKASLQTAAVGGLVAAADLAHFCSDELADRAVSHALELPKSLGAKLTAVTVTDMLPTGPYSPYPGRPTVFSVIFAFDERSPSAQAARIECCPTTEVSFELCSVEGQYPG